CLARYEAVFKHELMPVNKVFYLAQVRVFNWLVVCGGLENLSVINWCFNPQKALKEAAIQEDDRK
ncbi:hypothetical protein Ancab_000320, partial [Ancistrocladus abbreviatus]